MAVYKIHKTKDYTVMSNYHLRDKNLTLKAKGLLSVMLSLPDDWDYSVNGLVAICKENNTAVETALKELKQVGYLIIKRITPDKTKSGRMEYEYHIYENPQQAEIQLKEIQGIEKQGVEILPIENRPQLSKDKLSKDKSIINKLSKEDIGEKRQRFIPPTIQEVSEYCKERNNKVSPERFVDYYTSNGWQIGKNKMKDWKAAVRTWERNNFENKAGKTYGETGVEIKKPAGEDILKGIL